MGFFDKLFGSKKEVKAEKPEKIQEDKKVEAIVEAVLPAEEVKPLAHMQNNDVRRLSELGKSWGMLLYITREDGSVFVDGPKDKVAEAIAAGAQGVDSSLFSVPIEKVIWCAAPAKIDECKGKVKKQGLNKVAIKVTKPTEIEFTGK